VRHGGCTGSDHSCGVSHYGRPPLCLLCNGRRGLALGLAHRLPSHSHIAVCAQVRKSRWGTTSLEKSVCLPARLCVWVWVYLRACLSVCVSVSPNCCLCACAPVYLYRCLSVYLSTCLSACLPASLPACVCVYLSTCLSVCEEATTAMARIATPAAPIMPHSGGRPGVARSSGRWAWWWSRFLGCGTCCGESGSIRLSKVKSVAGVSRSVTLQLRDGVITDPCRGRNEPRTLRCPGGCRLAV
jgi:hypothetical protein